jgi:hypothetical protein
MIECVDMRSSSRGIEEDHPFRFRGMVTRFRSKRIVSGRLQFVADSSQRDGSKPARGAAEKFAT